MAGQVTLRVAVTNEDEGEVGSCSYSKEFKRAAVRRRRGAIGVRSGRYTRTIRPPVGGATVPRRRKSLSTNSLSTGPRRTTSPSRNDT